MDRLLAVRLEAHNSDRNHHRYFELEVGRDLFAVVTLTVRYGRCGGGGQERRYAAADPSLLPALVRRHLRRRRTAPRRLGTGYRLVRQAGADDGLLTGWLPADLTDWFPPAAGGA